MSVLDFDDYLGAYDEIKKRGDVVYALRQDVPARILMAAFLIKPLPQRVDALKNDATLSDEEKAARVPEIFDAFYAEYHRVCLAIVQHTYPHETSADLNRKLSDDEQKAVVQHFFTRPQPPSGVPSNTTEPTLTATGATTSADPSATAATATLTAPKRSHHRRK